METRCSDEAKRYIYVRGYTTLSLEDEPFKKGGVVLRASQARIFQGFAKRYHVTGITLSRPVFRISLFCIASILEPQ